MIDEIVSIFLQILVFTLIPFLVYLIQNRSVQGFLNYVGLKKSVNKANYLAGLVSLLMTLPILFLVLMNPDFKEIMTDPNSLTGRFRQMGFGMTSILTLVLVAVFKTALAEEILFRGFIAKRLISVTNYQTGNIIQAVIFGAIHSALFMTITNNILFLTMIFLFPAAGSYLMVYLNEKSADGCIIPGWIAHGLANLISYSVIGFLI
jgi:membrane protease YdiL (CAAX protease family)